MVPMRVQTGDGGVLLPFVSCGRLELDRRPLAPAPVVDVDVAARRRRQEQPATTVKHLESLDYTRA
jgi:hypothetical protein